MVVFATRCVLSCHRVTKTTTFVTCCINALRNFVTKFTYYQPHSLIFHHYCWNDAWKSKGSAAELHKKLLSLSCNCKKRLHKKATKVLRISEPRKGFFLYGLKKWTTYTLHRFYDIYSFKLLTLRSTLHISMLPYVIG